MQASTTSVLSVFALLAMPSLAMAGPLAKTGRAIDNKSSSSSSSSSSSGSTSTNNPRPSTPHPESSRGNYTSGDTGHLTSSSTSCDGCSSETQPLRLPVPTVELGLAAQKVRDSDGSVRIDARMLFGRLGLYAGGDYYFEEITDHGEPKSTMSDRSEYVRVNLFELAVLGRLVDSKVLQADVHAGLGVAASSLFKTLPGSALGFSLRARASESVSLRVEGRAMALRHNIQAYEGATGVQFRALWLGYRALQFDVGQVLQGPEAGVRFQF